VAKAAVPSTVNRSLPLPFIPPARTMFHIGTDAFVRPPSLARLAVRSVVKGNGYFFWQSGSGNGSCEVRLLRAQAHSVADRSLTALSLKNARGQYLAPTEIQSVVKITATSRRAQYQGPGFEPPTVTHVPWLRPSSSAGRGKTARAARTELSTRETFASELESIFLLAVPRRGLGVLHEREGHEFTRAAKAHKWIGL
jgi:hypothetical protein